MAFYTLANIAVWHMKAGRHIDGKQDIAEGTLSPIARNHHGVQVHNSIVMPVDGGCD